MTEFLREHSTFLIKRTFKGPSPLDFCAGIGKPTRQRGCPFHKKATKMNSTTLFCAATPAGISLLSRFAYRREPASLECMLAVPPSGDVVVATIVRASEIGEFMFELRNVARSLLAGERPGKDRRREEQSHHFHGGALHGLGVQQGVGSMHMGFEFPEKSSSSQRLV